MKVLVYPHELIVGGSPINAIDLAASIVEHGHEAIVYAQEGPLCDYIISKGLRFVAAHPMRCRPAPTRIWQLARLARRENVDLIHGYEWPPCLDAYYGAHILGGVPVVCTVLSMSLVPLVPDSIPLILGTQKLGDDAQTGRRGPVSVVEPPIDTDLDNPSVDGGPFRLKQGVRPDELLVVTVSRLAVDLKLDALVRAIDAVCAVAAEIPVRLVVVGDGEAFPALSKRAALANSRVGREVVTFAGVTLDPRPAYAAADVIVGMGSSVLRAMAFEKPVVVQGEQGFSMIAEPSTVELFLWQGFHGVGSNREGGNPLVDQLRGLLADGARRRALGRWGRQLVVERFSLRSATSALLKVYERALEPRTLSGRLAREASATGWRALCNEFRLHLPDDKRARERQQSRELERAGAGGLSAGCDHSVPSLTGS